MVSAFARHVSRISEGKPEQSYCAILMRRAPLRACTGVVNALRSPTRVPSLRVRNSLTTSFDPAAALSHPYQQENERQQNVSKEQDYEEPFGNDRRPRIELSG